jgi:hypothetical protein
MPAYVCCCWQLQQCRQHHPPVHYCSASSRQRESSLVSLQHTRTLSRARLPGMLQGLWPAVQFSWQASPAELSHHALLLALRNMLAAPPLNISRLTLRAGWWSEKKSLFDLSIVTGLTVSRLDQLEAQCRAWKGPLTAAVYLVVHVPTGATQIDGSGLELMQKAEKSMAEFHQRCAQQPLRVEDVPVRQGRLQQRGSSHSCCC